MYAERIFTTKIQGDVYIELPKEDPDHGKSTPGVSSIEEEDEEGDVPLVGEDIT